MNFKRLDYASLLFYYCSSVLQSFALGYFLNDTSIAKNVSLVKKPT